MEHTIRECGCTTATGRSGNPFIVYCPKHKAAPDLYEALKEIKQLCAGSAFKQSVEQQIIAGKCFLALAKTEMK